MTGFQPKHYGITGANEAYIKEHDIHPNEAGAYPRLDDPDKIIQTIQTVTGFVRVDLPYAELEGHIADAFKVWRELVALRTLRIEYEKYVLPRSRDAISSRRL